MLAKTYHFPCVHFSCVIALLSARILRYVRICFMADRTELIFSFSVFNKLLKLIFYCNKSITLIAVMPPLFRCFYAEGDNGSEKEKKEKKRKIKEERI